MLARRPLLLAATAAGALLPAATAQATDVVDATGRHVAVPGSGVARVLPAGPPAAVLLAALAPDLMLGWPGRVPEGAAEWLSETAAGRPAVPRLTGREDVAGQVRALAPDLIVDYGDTGPRYARLAEDTQAQLGVPTLLLDGALPRTPQALRLLGAALRREGRAEELARLAEAVLATAAASSPGGDAPPRVVYARGGADGMDVAAGGTAVTGAFAAVGWPVLAPEGGQGTWRRATVAQIAALDPDLLLFQDEAARDAVRNGPAWRDARAVREGHAFVVPMAPFGWLAEPPSINRLLGLAALAEWGGGAPVGLAALFHAAVYGRALGASQLRAVRECWRPIRI